MLSPLCFPYQPPDPIISLTKVTKLLPSFYDRKSYFDILCGKENNVCGESAASSCQRVATNVFSRMISREVSRNSGFRGLESLLLELVHQTLDKMGVMYVEIVNEVNMAQVFLWLQEKSLFGEASLLFNPSPGVYFTATDMARNLLLSPGVTFNPFVVFLFSQKNHISLLQAVHCLPVPLRPVEVRFFAAV